MNHPRKGKRNERGRKKRQKKKIRRRGSTSVEEEETERVCVSHTANQAGMPRRCSCKGLIKSTSPGRLTHKWMSRRQQSKQKNASKPDS